MASEISIKTEEISNLQKRLGTSKNIFYHKALARELWRPDYPVKQDFFAVILFESGNGTHFIDDAEFPIQGKQIHVVFPEQSHYWKFDADTVGHQLFISKEVFVNFSVFLQFPESIYKKYPVIALSTEKFNKIVHEYKDIGDEQNDPNIMDDNIICLKAKIILQSISNEIEQLFEELGHSHFHPILYNFILLIKKYFKYEKMVRFYAGKLGVTANYLNVLCKKYLGKTATDCIEEEILKEVKHQLINSSNLLLDIAMECGFQNYPSFSKCFKKHFGTSPKEFRMNVTLHNN
ncbi:helix-turn-helix transcriptional regulator [Chryseobacterium camelliae]|uniref:Helix-turn-helix transcriptional regulator n=1 Tax=Chryseobacterium camelliae TaxID=1265445 RepID=A0ABY7QPW6_9FLAO|nr:helix-turn-helix transcriptional regulator [Chryseobacterium camelliae]WBV61244.1 helix-turn-helix transcriptional regulator [Chryseobacterium camelliae]